jgi:hypothetical protein
MSQPASTNANSSIWYRKNKRTEINNTTRLRLSSKNYTRYWILEQKRMCHKKGCARLSCLLVYRSNPTFFLCFSSLLFVRLHHSSLHISCGNNREVVKPQAVPSTRLGTRNVAGKYRTYIYIYIYIYICACVQALASSYVCASVNFFIYMCVCASVSFFVHVCASVNFFICACVQALAFSYMCVCVKR